MQSLSQSLAIVVVTFGTCPTVFSQAPKVATVPLILEDNRVFVELTFHRADGSPRQARAWVDTGGGSFLVTDRLAHELGLARTGPETSSDDGREVPLSKPSVSLGVLPLDVNSTPGPHGIGGVFAVLGSEQIAPGIKAEAFLPACVLMHYHVVFDYPDRTFTIAMPGVLVPRGERVSVTVQAESGFPRIELTVDGKSYGFLLDTGAAYTMISRELLDNWAAVHKLPRLIGAVGAANMLSDETDAGVLLVRLPSMHWGRTELRQVGVVSRGPGVFEKYMTRLMSGPVVGAIAGNVLKAFRIEIDYPRGCAYIEKTSEVDRNDLDSVGLILGVTDDGTYRVTGVARQQGSEVVEGIRAGDKLISIDGWPVMGASRDSVIRSLQGHPGERHKLRLRRDGGIFEVEAAIRHLL